jgi:hypothetical protein
MQQFFVMLHTVAAVIGGIPSLIGARVRSTVPALARRDDGQAVTEYTLVILVAATVALLLLNWAQGGAIAAFFDTIFDQVTGMFTA